jgi:hypothetical protein
MRKRGPKPKATDVGCPYKTCTDHNIIGEGNVVKNGGYQLRQQTCSKISLSQLW